MAKNGHQRRPGEKATLKIHSMERQELERIINRAPVVAFLWRAAPGWPVEFVSRNIGKFGYGPEEFLSGKISYAEIIHPEDLDRVAAEVKKHSEDNVSEFTQEYRILTKSETVRWIDDRTWVRRDSEGAITHYQGVILDTTERKRIEAEKAGLIRELQQALAKIKTLSGLLPICASCKKVRDDKGYWTEIESYIQKHTEADCSHGICPDCIKKLYPDFRPRNKGKGIPGE